MTAFHVRRSAFLTGVAVSLSGCFSYVPTEFEAVPAGQSVRVWVTQSVMADIQQQVPISEPVVRGEVMERGPESLFLRVPTGRRQVGFHSAELGANVPIPIAGIVQLERREFDRIGTGALVAGIAGGAAVVLFVILEAFGSRDGDGECTGEDCEELLGRVLSIPIP